MPSQRLSRLSNCIQCASIAVSVGVAAAEGHCHFSKVFHFFLSSLVLMEQNLQVVSGAFTSSELLISQVNDLFIVDFLGLEFTFAKFC